MLTAISWSTEYESWEVNKMELEEVTCPVCGSNNVEEDTLEWDDATYGKIWFWCNDCDAEFYAEFHIEIDAIRREDEH